MNTKLKVNGLDLNLAESMKSRGYLKTPRMIISLLYSPIKEYREVAGLYFYLISRAYFAPRTLMLEGRECEIERGEFFDQKKEICRQLKVSRWKLNSWMEVLKRLKALELKLHGHFIIFRITGYDEICGQLDRPETDSRKARAAMTVGERIAHDMEAMEHALGGRSMYGGGL